MQIIIDNFDFWNCEPMKYYDFPKQYKYDKKEKAKELILSEFYYGAEKISGIWCMIIKKDDKFYIKTKDKDNVSYKSTERLQYICSELCFIKNGTVLVCVLYFPNDKKQDIVDYKIINLIERQIDLMHCYIFDIIAYENKSLLNICFQDRISFLNNLKKNNFNFVRIAEYKSGEALWKFYKDIINNGGNGIIIQHQDNIYECGKKTAWKTLKLGTEIKKSINAFIDGNYQLFPRLYTGMDIENWDYWENSKTQKKYHENKFKEYALGTEAVEPITKEYYYNLALCVSFSVIKNKKIVPIAWISDIPMNLRENIVTNPERWKYKVASLTMTDVKKVNNQYIIQNGKIEKWQEDINYKDCMFTQIKT